MLVRRSAKKKVEGKKTEENTSFSARSLLAGIPDPQFVADKDLNIIYFNGAVSKLTGYSSEEAIGMKCYDVFKSNICDNGCAIKHCMATDSTIVGAEVIIQKRDGEPITILASGAPVKDDAGVIIGGMETMRDITEEKRRERQIHHEAARAHARIYDAIFATDTEQNITYFNDAAEKITGYSRSEVIGKKCHDIFNSNICDNGCAIKGCMSSGRPATPARRKGTRATECLRARSLKMSSNSRI